MRVLDEAGFAQALASARATLALSLESGTWPELQSRIDGLELRFLADAPNELSVLETRRRFASDRLSAAVWFHQDWLTVQGLWERIEQLGYSNLAHRQQTLFDLVGWAQRAQHVPGLVLTALELARDEGCGDFVDQQLELLR